MRYRDYLESDHWKQLKLKKSRRAKLCWCCRKEPENPNFHHHRYKSLTDATTSDIRLMCQDCHHFYHAVVKDNPRWDHARVMNHVRKLRRAVQNQFTEDSVPDFVAPRNKPWDISCGTGKNNSLALAIA